MTAAETADQAQRALPAPVFIGLLAAAVTFCVVVLAVEAAARRARRRAARVAYRAHCDMVLRGER